MLEFLSGLWYIEHKEGHLLVTDAPQEPTPKVDFPSGLFTSQREALVLVATGRALFFSLVFLISVEKGKQRYNKATKGNQQADYTYKYQYDIRSSHWRHLPSYVFRHAGHWLGRLPPLSWVPYGNTTTVRQEFQSDSLFVEYVESASKSISKQSHGTKRKTGKP